MLPYAEHILETELNTSLKKPQDEVFWFTDREQGHERQDYDQVFAIGREKQQELWAHISLAPKTTLFSKTLGCL